MSSLTERMIRAAKLDATLYEEVEADRDATGQAMSVVILSSLAVGLGSFVLHSPVLSADLRLPWTRVLVWGLFALLSVLQVRVVGFFAVATVPMAILNSQDLNPNGR